VVVHAHKSSIDIALDGEIDELPLKFSILGALAIVVPDRG